MKASWMRAVVGRRRKTRGLVRENLDREEIPREMVESGGGGGWDKGRIFRVVQNRLGADYIYEKGEEFGSSDYNRTVENKILRESKQINEDILGMFGVDPDPSVTTAWFGFGAVSDAHARGHVHCTERLRFRQEGKQRTRLVLERSTKAKQSEGR